MEDVGKEEAIENAGEDRQRCHSRGCWMVGWSGERDAVTRPWESCLMPKEQRW